MVYTKPCLWEGDSVFFIGLLLLETKTGKLTGSINLNLSSVLFGLVVNK